MFTPTWPAALTAGQLDDARSRLNETRGGRAETDVNDVAVKPTGGVAAAVTTPTDAACRRSSARNRSGSMGVLASLDRRRAEPVADVMALPSAGARALLFRPSGQRIARTPCSPRLPMLRH